jgi:hypothetical protein
LFWFPIIEKVVQHVNYDENWMFHDLFHDMIHDQETTRTGSASGCSIDANSAEAKVPQPST